MVLSGHLWRVKRFRCEEGSRERIELASKIVVLSVLYRQRSKTNEGWSCQAADAEAKEKQLQYCKSLAERNLSATSPRQSRVRGYDPSHLTNETQPTSQSVTAPRSNKPGSNGQSYNAQTSLPSNNNWSHASPYELPPDLPDRSTSPNRFINKTRTWTRQLGQLCVNCGKCAHNSKHCTDGYIEQHGKGLIWRRFCFVTHQKVSFVNFDGGDMDHNAELFWLLWHTRSLPVICIL